jgi:hypothetical protein
MTRRSLWLSLALALLPAAALASCNSAYSVVSVDADSGNGTDASGIATMDSTATTTDAPSSLPPFDPGSDAGDITDAFVSLAEAGACSTGCRLVFVTNAKFSGNLGGIAGGDAKCKSAAMASTSADVASRATKFVAWLSAGNSGAAGAGDRLADGQYRRPDGALVASNLAGLLSGTLQAPIDVTELGQTVGGGASVWTGTATDGTVSNAKCSSWVDSTPTIGGDIGNATSNAATWTKKATVACASGERLYCFEGP